ncbi:Uncharacterised protein [Mycobacterium tuberculosis]|uniref:Uncharacterized protein n=1 Tax=Mycobacterium tuberculosis TaxID=1773 RepID=A0A0T7PJJ5_MYCTX|nr:Uncharacterised protein [Mycobacterium tuberculosis]CKT56061.1 Uncharacterised protein [Mycobacterium tuberculosis]CKU11573.1 Uncharacterised protein [Mycobacterium tuberculosis]CNV81646.1 Uncharacterised protein [Mycobacterium tuberculosis]COX38054.1 Uncharacterised protein [Mycobacterium tuberculosis]
MAKGDVGMDKRTTLTAVGAVTMPFPKSTVVVYVAKM